MYQTNFQRGFTIIELTIYVGFLALISTALVSIMLASNDVQFENEEKQIIRETATDIFDSVQDDIAVSTAVTTPNAGETGQTLVLSTSGDSVTYTLSNSQITRQVGIAAAKVITPDNLVIDELIFGSVGSDLASGISVSITSGDTSFYTVFSLPSVYEGVVEDGGEGEGGDDDDDDDDEDDDDD